MTDADTRSSTGRSLALAGSAVGVVAGVVQSAVGSDLATWTGDKESPGALGLLTIVLSAIAGIASSRLRTANTYGRQLALGVLIAVVALVCFSTVGRLWFVPGPLMLIGVGLAMPAPKESLAIISRNWWRVLLATLGVCELLMAVGATTIVLVIGVVGGTALIAAAWLGSGNRMAAGALLAIGTVPFAIVARAALVPVLLAVVVAAVAVPIMGTSRPEHRPG